MQKIFFEKLDFFQLPGLDQFFPRYCDLGSNDCFIFEAKTRTSLVILPMVAANLSNLKIFW